MRENIKLILGNFEAGERGLAALASEKDRFLDSLETAVKYAKVLGAPRYNIFYISMHF